MTTPNRDAARTFTVLRRLGWSDDEYEVMVRCEPAGDHALAAQFAAECGEGPLTGRYVVIEQEAWREFTVGANVVVMEVKDDE